MEQTVAELYQRWAEIEVKELSPIFYDWATSIADDSEVLGLIDDLPTSKRQPNLVFTAARFCGAPVGSYSELRPWLLSRWLEVESVIRERATQTNEAGRCAVLLPVLSRLRGPLALIEVGASAGLCLYPDQYSYRYDTDQGVVPLDPTTGPSSVELSCRIEADSVPNQLPTVVFRAGIDLNPVDLRDSDQVKWLETLIWPEHDDRRHRFRAAAELVAADPPTLVKGDLLDNISALITEAPKNAGVVVFHSAVLVYLTPERRDQFVELMESMPDVTWISNEGEDVLPTVASRISVPVNGRTVLALNGRPCAVVGPHGQSYERIGIAEGASKKLAEGLLRDGPRTDAMGYGN